MENVIELRDFQSGSHWVPGSKNLVKAFSTFYSYHSLPATFYVYDVELVNMKGGHLLGAVAKLSEAKRNEKFSFGGRGST
jgi:hypothetical protein